MPSLEGAKHPLANERHSPIWKKSLTPCAPLAIVKVEVGLIIWSTDYPLAGEPPPMAGCRGNAVHSLDTRLVGVAEVSVWKKAEKGVCVGSHSAHCFPRRFRQRQSRPNFLLHNPVLFLKRSLARSKALAHPPPPSSHRTTFTLGALFEKKKEVEVWLGGERKEVGGGGWGVVASREALRSAGETTAFSGVPWAAGPSRVWRNGHYRRGPLWKPCPCTPRLTSRGLLIAAAAAISFGR